MNAAVALRAALIDTVQVRAVPVHAPLQPLKVEPTPGAAVRVTEVPATKDVLHTVLVTPVAVGVVQPTPAGAEVTLPAEVVLALLTVTLSVWGGSPKVAVTARAAVIDTVQLVAVPVQPPDQPVKVEPAAAAAVSVTEVPPAKLAEQTVDVAVFVEAGEAQLTPAGEEVTVPLAVETVRLAVTLSVCAVSPKLAVTDLAALMATVHVVAVPVQLPDQPVKTDPVAGLAVRMTDAPCA